MRPAAVRPQRPREVCLFHVDLATADPEVAGVGWSDADSSDGAADADLLSRPGRLLRSRELVRRAAVVAASAALLCALLGVAAATAPRPAALVDGLPQEGAARLHEQHERPPEPRADDDAPTASGGRPRRREGGGGNQKDAATTAALHDVLSALKIAVRGNNASRRHPANASTAEAAERNSSRRHSDSASTTAEPPACGDVGDDCSRSRCCKDASRVCFEKVPTWATCLPDCAPGVHARDPPKFQQPWSCRMLAPRGQPDFPSLFCFMAMRSSGVERELVAHQVEESSGIFSCDDYEVFSDLAINLGRNITSKPLEHFAARSAVQGALTATWVNTDAFAEAWGAVVHSPRPWRHDWMVKVDPDTVFFPVRLKVHLQGLHRRVREADTGAGVYFRNCAAASLQLYGSLEVLSHKALGRLSDRGAACDGADNARMGEDMWLQRCLDALGVNGLDDSNLLRDGYCPVGGAKDCAFGPVAFHPYKAVEQWRTCWTMAVSDEAAVSLKK